MNNIEYLSETERTLLIKCPYVLTLTIEELTKPSKKKSNNHDKPPRPQNSFIIFRKDYEANLRLRNHDVKQTVKHTAKECSRKWKLQSKEVKDFFKILSKIAREKHKRIYPGYKYQPKIAKDPNIRKLKFRECVFTSPAKSSTINSDSFQKTIEINRSPFTPQETIPIDVLPSLISNSSRKTIHGLPSLKSAISAFNYQNQNTLTSVCDHKEITINNGQNSIDVAYNDSNQLSISFEADYFFVENNIGNNNNNEYNGTDSENHIIDTTSTLFIISIPITSQYNLSDVICDNLLPIHDNISLNNTD